MNETFQARREARRRWLEVRRAEGWYARQLRNVASQVGQLVRGLAPEGEVQDRDALREALYRYSDALKPWAVAVTRRMHAEVGRRDEQAWLGLAASVGAALRRELRRAETGHLVRSYLDMQVDLITSLPLQAARRVHRLTLEASVDATRAKEVAKEILATGQVTRSRASLIARTEVARTQSLITQARAEHVGSPGYIWRTVGDSDVRPGIGTANFAAFNTLAKGSHRKLNGTVHRWSEPPIAGTRGERAHPGQIYNCRCYAEAILDESRLRELVAS